MTNSTLEGPRPAQDAKAGSMEVALADVKARVDKINFQGVGRTKDDVLVNISKQLFDSHNFEDVVFNAKLVRDKLQQLGAFKGIGIMIDASHGSEATVHGYEVTFHLVESNRLTGGVHTYIGNNNTGSLITQLRAPNALGRGETIAAELQKGTKHTSGYNLTLSKPLAPWTDNNPTLSLHSFQQGADAPWSHFRQIDRGLVAGLTHKFAGVGHEIRWEGVWRDVSCLRDAAFAVREQAGHTLKCSVKHVVTKDTRDHSVLPTEGSLVRLEQELAGLGGNVGFFKNEVELQHNITFLGDFVLQGTFRAGHLRAAAPALAKPPPDHLQHFSISDRFLIGGPLTLRGFKLFGVGPHSDGCALGADTYWLGGLHVYTPLPFRPGQGGLGEIIRTHFFINAGSIANLNGSSSRAFEHLSNRLRYSAGVGVVIAISGARFELNYAYPFSVQSGDKVDSRLQFGLGINFV